MLGRMRGMAAIALGPALWACGCAAGQASPAAPEPVVVVVGETAQKSPEATAQKKPRADAAKAKHSKQSAAAKDLARKAGILGAARGASRPREYADPLPR